MRITDEEIRDRIEQDKARKAEERAAFIARLNDGDLLKKGSPATMSSGSDRYPQEVIGAVYFQSGKKKGMPKFVFLRQMDYRCISGNMYEGAKYECTPNPNGPLTTAKAFYNKDGELLSIGRHRDFGSVMFGGAEYYCDPHF